MKFSLPLVLSLNGGYVDTAGFLALQGLFPAHVTGNFVTLGAALVMGTSGVVAKLIALPVFCLVVAIVRIIGAAFGEPRTERLRVMLAIKVILLSLGAMLAIRLGPFPDGDTWQALLTGMLLVSAMAVQNALQRVHLPGTPPTTIMTGNTTQATIDAVDLLQGRGDRAAVRARFQHLTGQLAIFAIGSAAAALLYAKAGMWCFVVPPFLGLVSVVLPAEASAVR